MKLPAALALGLLLLGSVGTAHAHDGAWHDIGRESLARGLVFEDLTPAGANGRCKEGFELRLPGGRIGCTHGPDPAPPGRDVREPLTMGDIAATTTGDPSEGGASGPGDVLCVGDGVNGNRVQAVYAYPADGPDNYDAIAPYIRQWAGQADFLINKSAAETGGVRHVRFVTDFGCQLDVAKVALTPQGVASLAGTAADLHAQGFDRSDRKYLVWVDAYVYCGVATVEPDDRPGQDNANNGNGEPGMIARVDRGCWGNPASSAEAHEVTHLLGGVQPTAPHGTWNYHCSDESELMCYDDDSTRDGYVGSHGQLVPLTQVCPKSHEPVLDCNHDDYFSTSPRADSWLGQHWNVADSSFLTSDGPASAPDTSAPRATAPKAFLAGQLRRRVPVLLRWGSKDADVAGYWLWRSVDGRTWRYVERKDLWMNTARVRVRRDHSYRFLVHAFDQAGNASPAQFGRSFSIRVLQERNRAVSYRGRWRQLYRSTASARHLASPRSGPVRSKLRFYGKAVAWVAPTSLEGGLASIFLDRRYARWVDLTSESPAERQIVFSHRFARRGWHTIAVRPQSAGVSVDAFVLLR
jgi:hypothetical protein